MSSPSVIFYHGTDARIVRMTTEERKNFRAMVDEIIHVLWPIYKPYIDGSMQYGEYELFVLLNRNERLFDFVRQRLGYWYGQTMNNKLYQYQEDGLYVRMDKIFADNYANTARFFGEIGSIAYAMAYPLKLIKQASKFNQDFTDKLNKFLDFCSQTPEPVVYEFNLSSCENLIDENGNSLSNEIFFDIFCVNPCLRIVKEVDLSSMTPIDVDIDNIHFDMSPYEYKEIHNVEYPTFKRGDKIKIIKNCGDFLKLGEYCTVNTTTQQNLLGVIPYHHFQLFMIPIENVCLINRLK